MLHHALCDDGDVCFVEHQIHGSSMLMYNKHDTELVEKQMAKRFPSHRGIVYTYEIHDDVKRFIKAFNE